MFVDSQPADALIHAMAIRLARQCREIVQACLRPEEFRDADMEFYRVIRSGLEEMKQPPAIEAMKGGPHAAQR